jgi:phosphonoacetaldehyde hydrolase
MPWMIYRNLIELQIHPPASCVKVGDTVSDIKEGLNAGMWTVGVVETGNEMGLSQTEIESLADPEREQRLAAARTVLLEAGAHFLVDRVAAIDPVVDKIEHRLRWGVTPV